MSILYSVVAREKNIVAKHAVCDGNFSEITEVILSKIMDSNVKMTYLHGRYLFHFISSDNGIYLCVTEKTCQRSRAFLFLNEIRRKFECSKSELNKVLSEEMYRYSENYSTITVLPGELDDINSIRVDDSENILGEKMLVVRNPDNVEYSSISCTKPQSEVVKVVEDINFNNIEDQSSDKSAVLYVVLTIIGFVVYVFGPSPYNHLFILIIGIKYLFT